MRQRITHLVLDIESAPQACRKMDALRPGRTEDGSSTGPGTLDHSEGIKGLNFQSILEGEPWKLPTQLAATIARIDTIQLRDISEG
jgi:hypothetical protein